MDILSVMFEGMLSRKVKVNSHTGLLKNGAFGVKSRKGNIDFFEGCFGDGVTSH